jgi:small-conductance mechanosensitive channel
MHLPMDWTKWGVEAVSAGTIAAAVVAGLILHWFIFRVLFRYAARADTWLEHVLVQRWRHPARYLIPLLMLILISPTLHFQVGLQVVVRNLFVVTLTITLAWMLINTVFVMRDLILRPYDLQVKDNLKARVMHTQVNLAVKIFLVIIIITAIVSILMTFEKVRQLGLSIMASAGVLGMIIGFAAQRSIATIFAGFQVAITQPIRIDDVVIVEGEWGWIENITLTYVVVRIWDLRRLVVPTNYFLEKPFQNWTRRSADLLGTVFLYVDYSVPVEEIRRELYRLLAASSLWDGKVWNVQVTNCAERAVELRCLMSAADAPSAWDLRCEIREKLIDYIRKYHPGSFPKLRARIEEETQGGPVSYHEHG